MSTPVVELRGVCKQYGPLEAVRDVDLEIEAGRVVGFIGANGAGKTTTMRMIATLEVPTRGSIRICGEDNLWHPARARARIGWMPDRFGVYPLVTVREYVDFFARAQGLVGDAREARVREILAFTELDALASRYTDALSTGMKQRLSLARALVHGPELLVLDEPAAGLDPAARVGFKQLVRKLAAEGRTLFISSHILSELAEMCDELVLIDEGRIVYQGTADSLDAADEPLLRVDVLDPVERLDEWISLQPEAVRVELHRRGALLRLRDPGDAAAAALLRRMVAEGLSVVGFVRERPTLERSFIALLEKLRS